MIVIGGGFAITVWNGIFRTKSEESYVVECQQGEGVSNNAVVFSKLEVDGLCV